MGHHKLREDKTCLNCGNEVQGRFCSNCGQENVESRHSFHYLFTHFLEDLLHYDGSFWKTIKSLLLKPGKLTVEYLKGKRASYVAPVKLYIFIAFVAFFVPAVVSFFHDKDKEIYEINTEQTKQELNKVITQLDSIQKVHSKNDVVNEELSKVLTELENNEQNNPEAVEIIREINDSGVNYGPDFRNLKTVAQLDSIQKIQPENKKLNWAEYRFIKKVIELKKDATNKEFKDKFLEMLSKNFSKVLFIYMPIFAFLLWLFHGKKKWYYFDHGIFTLHYFSFLLVLSTIFFLWEFFTSFIGIRSISDTLNFLALWVVMFYPFFYFFRAHSKVYGENKWISRLKSLALFFINMVCMSFVATIYLFIIAWNVH